MCKGSVYSSLQYAQCTDYLSCKHTHSMVDSFTALPYLGIKSIISLQLQCKVNKNIKFKIIKNQCHRLVPDHFLFQMNLISVYCIQLSYQDIDICMHNMHMHITCNILISWSSSGKQYTNMRFIWKRKCSGTSLWHWIFIILNFMFL